jgi:serine/threonine-protein phosphatase CPPED1
MLHPARTWKLLIIFLILTGCSTKPVCFIQMTDPQMGMFSDNKNMNYEIDHLKLVVDRINTLQPAFVVISGDLTNLTGDSAQINTYLRLISGIKSSIPVHNVPGNHDVGEIPTSASLELYRGCFGKDYYWFKNSSLFCIVLNSSLMRNDSLVKEEASEQDHWLDKTLAHAHRSGKTILVFMHHPLFMDRPGEPTGYENFPEPERSEYLSLFKKYDVKMIFSGHLHRNRILDLNGIEQITTAALTTNLGRDSSGIRMVCIRDGILEHNFIPIDSISSQNSYRE